jgi:mono/diheme cytochrome c family protein
LLAILGLMSLGAIPVLWQGPLLAAWPNAYRWLRGAFFWLVVPGLLASLAWLFASWILPPARPAGENPVPVSTASLERGLALYSQNCLPCHGPNGRGDGPAAMALFPRPSNLQVHAVPGVHSDAQLFEWISNGYPGTAMPAFGDLLGEVERWDLVNYIRTLRNP